MKRVGIVCMVLLAIQSIAVTAQNKTVHQFGFSGREFHLDGKPFHMISGELHPARIPREYWRHRIQMAKAMGCNTIAVYIFWNYHEIKQGQFDFKTGNRDMAAFIRLCQEEGMWVLLRPGPYVCGEWDFGGLPSYLLAIPDIKIRCMDKRYMAAVSRYIKALAREVKPLQVQVGGPILMSQVENEYGSFGNDREYMSVLARMWREEGITVPFYTADGPTPYMLEAGTVKGAAIGLDSGSDSAAFAEAYKVNPDIPVFSSESYPGWLTHWGEKWASRGPEGISNEVKFLLKNKYSFNLYVIHGGTNFGYTAGANAFSPVQYQPDVTSYDYDAPISESGNATPKYYVLRNIIEKHTGKKLPPVPAPVPHMNVAPIAFKKVKNIFQYELPAVKTVQPQPMEYFGQNQGLIMYRTKLIGHKSGKLQIWEPHDYALVFLNGAFIDTVFRDGGNWEVDLPVTNEKEPVLTIIVEGMGHINFGQYMIDRKGITDRVSLNGMTLMNWETILYPMDEDFIKVEHPLKRTMIPDSVPCNFFEGNFTLPEASDTFFDMSGYKKGVVFVNGHNLGRYWYTGPQKRLYCPAGWLKKGDNKMVVFDLLATQPATVSGYKELQ